MKFIVDAQLPRKLATLINDLGGEAVHTLDLPFANLTTDSQIIEIARQEKRVVNSKDTDFVNSLLLHGKPEKLLSIATGNCSNVGLLRLLSANWPQILSMLEEGSYVELNSKTLMLHF